MFQNLRCELFIVGTHQGGCELTKECSQWGACASPCVPWEDRVRLLCSAFG